MVFFALKNPNFIGMLLNTTDRTVTYYLNYTEAAKVNLKGDKFNFAIGLSNDGGLKAKITAPDYSAYFPDVQ